MHSIYGIESCLVLPARNQAQSAWENPSLRLAASCRRLMHTPRRRCRQSERSDPRGSLLNWRILAFFPPELGASKDHKMYVHVYPSACTDCASLRGAQGRGTRSKYASSACFKCQRAIELAAKSCNFPSCTDPRSHIDSGRLLTRPNTLGSGSDQMRARRRQELRLNR